MIETIVIDIKTRAIITTTSMKINSTAMPRIHSQPSLATRKINLRSTVLCRKRSLYWNFYFASLTKDKDISLSWQNYVYVSQ